MKLIGSLTSPYVRKARVVMAEKKIDYQFVLENAWADESTLQEINPLGKVPVLVMDEREAIFDSRVIVEYLDTVTPVGKLIPASGKARLEVKCWEALADGVMDAAALIFIENNRREPRHRSSQWIARQMQKIDAGLAAMAKGLGENPFCTGINFTLADVAVGCALGYLDLRFADKLWRDEYPNLAKLADKLFARPSFVNTAPPQS
ncbi:MAG: glutathione S-transferase [Burkholderiaceae bacterium]|nr:MAG: glutathione S-transferase [Burkholderiaceae bacterium]